MLVISTKDLLQGVKKAVRAQWNRNQNDPRSNISGLHHSFLEPFHGIRSFTGSDAPVVNIIDRFAYGGREYLVLFLKPQHSRTAEIFFKF